MRRFILAILFVVPAVVIGKCCQKTRVAYLGTTLGFEGASLIGLAPFLGAMLLLKARYPQHFAFRGNDR